jgi:hypothetical protein
MTATATYRYASAPVSTDLVVPSTVAMPPAVAGAGVLEHPLVAVAALARVVATPAQVATRAGGRTAARTVADAHGDEHHAEQSHAPHSTTTRAAFELRDRSALALLRPLTLATLRTLSPECADDVGGAR